MGFSRHKIVAALLGDNNDYIHSIHSVRPYALRHHILHGAFAAHLKRVVRLAAAIVACVGVDLVKFVRSGLHNTALEMERAVARGALHARL